MSYQENKLMNLKDGRLLLKTLDERMKTEGFAPVMTNPYPDTIKTLENCAGNMGMGFEIPINPVQDLHGYEYPWAEGAGKNLMPNITAVRTEGEAIWIGQTDNTTYPIHLEANQAYTISFTANVTGAVYFKKNGGSNTRFGASGDTYTPSETMDVQMWVYATSGLTSVTNVQLEKGSSATPYMPYSNICPISGFTGVDISRMGKNLLNLGTLQNSACNTNNKIAIDSNAIAYYFKTSKLPNVITCSAVNGNRAYVCYTNDVPEAGVSCYDVDKASQTLPKTITVNKNYTYIHIQFAYNSSVSDIQVEEGASASQYEIPVKTYSFTWQSTAGTVYGGTVTINEDGSGRLVVDKKRAVYDGTGWNFIQTGSEYRAYREVNDIDQSVPDAEIGDIRSNMFMPSWYSKSGVTRPTNVITMRYGIAQFNIFQNIYTTSAEWTTFANANPIEVVYPLATPVSYDLTPQQITSLLGNTTVWNSIGAFSVSYHIDPKIYVDDTAGMAGSIANTDSTEASVKTLTDGADNLPIEVTVAINPVQDLHGQDSPWPIAGGVNKSLITVASIKSASSDLTWNGNSATSNGITFTILTDSDGNVTGINVNDTSTGTAVLNLYDISYCPLTQGTMYRLNGLWANGSSTTFKHDLIYNSSGVASVDLTKDAGSFFSVNADIASATRLRERLVIYAGQTFSNVKFYPMISVYNASSIPDYVPPTNVCPISGWDSVQITRTGKNLFDSNGEYRYKIYYDANGNMGTASTAPYPKLFMQKIHVLPNTVYSFSGKSTTNAYLRIYQFNSNDEFISRVISTSTTNPSVSVTTDANVSYILLGPDENVTEAQFEKGNVSTFEPYTGKTYPISLPTTAYGGTLTVNKDGSGRLVAKGIAEEKSLSTFTVVSTNTNTKRYRKSDFFASSVLRNSNAKCNVASYAFNSNDTVHFYPAGDNTSVDVFVPVDMSTDSVIQIYAELSTPVLFDFTAQQIRSLLGNVNVFSESGNVLNVVYYADTKMYIDNLFSTIVNGTGVSF